MDKKSDDHLLIMKYTIEANEKDSDEKTRKLTADLTAMIT